MPSLNAVTPDSVTGTISRHVVVRDPQRPPGNT